VKFSASQAEETRTHRVRFFRTAKYKTTRLQHETAQHYMSHSGDCRIAQRYTVAPASVANTALQAKSASLWARLGDALPLSTYQICCLQLKCFYPLATGEPTLCVMLWECQVPGESTCIQLKKMQQKIFQLIKQLLPHVNHVRNTS